mmetsp:Transcript_35011/g.100525  ORF Transcript_35011/g.100525 Transcript_35011/m.100525 type:complete len:123 (-) Transcript_35011:165-533(-)
MGQGSFCQACVCDPGLQSRALDTSDIDLTLVKVTAARDEPMHASSSRLEQDWWLDSAEEEPIWCEVWASTPTGPACGIKPTSVGPCSDEKPARKSTWRHLPWLRRVPRPQVRRGRMRVACSL